MVIQLTRNNGILHIQLHRPAALNAIDAAMRDALYEAFLTVRDDATINAVLLSGAGKGFCAGADLTEFGTANSVLQKRQIRLQHDIWELIRSCPKLVIVAIHGFAIGSGLELAMLADIRFATSSAKFALPEAAIGMMPAAGGTQSMSRLTTLSVTLQLALTGRRFTAQQAWQYGIVQQIVSEEALLDEAWAYLEKIDEQPKMAKQLKHLMLQLQ